MQVQKRQCILIEVERALFLAYILTSGKVQKLSVADRRPKWHLCGPLNWCWRIRVYASGQDFLVLNPRIWPTQTSCRNCGGRSREEHVLPAVRLAPRKKERGKDRLVKMTTYPSSVGSSWEGPGGLCWERKYHGWRLRFSLSGLQKFNLSKSPNSEVVILIEKINGKWFKWQCQCDPILPINLPSPPPQFSEANLKAEQCLHGPLFLLSCSAELFFQFTALLSKIYEVR